MSILWSLRCVFLLLLLMVCAALHPWDTFLCRGCLSPLRILSLRRPFCCDSLSWTLTETSPGLDNSFIFPTPLALLSSRGGVSSQMFPIFLPVAIPCFQADGCGFTAALERPELHLCRVFASKRSFPAANPTNVRKLEHALALLCPHFTWERN